jgi:hypothetical protein
MTVTAEEWRAICGPRENAWLDLLVQEQTSEGTEREGPSLRYYKQSTAVQLIDSLGNSRRRLRVSSSVCCTTFLRVRRTAVLKERMRSSAGRGSR